LNYRGGVMKEDISIEQLMEVIQRFIHNNRPRHKETMMRPSELMVMMTIAKYFKRHNSGIVPSQLSVELNLSRSAITPILNELENKGMIRREFDTNDRRKTIIVLTENHFAMMSQGCGFYRNTIDALIENLEPEEIASLYSVLTKANKILADYNSKENPE